MLHLFFNLCIQWYKEVIFSSISPELVHYRVMFPLLHTMRRERGRATTFHLFVLMRKILLIRHVIAETLLRMCAPLCIHLVHSTWEGHNLAACVVPTYVFFPSPFSIHWAVRLMLGALFFSAIRRCSVMPLWWHRSLFSSGESKWSSFSQTINPWGSLFFPSPPHLWALAFHLFYLHSRLYELSSAGLLI